MWLPMLTCRDGRLRENDHLLAVDGHLLGEKSSLEDAVQWLQAASGKVTLVVAHKTDSSRLLGYNSLSPTSSQPHAGELGVSHYDCQHYVYRCSFDLSFFLSFFLSFLLSFFLSSLPLPVISDVAWPFVTKLCQVVDGDPDL